jgi:hypothetical protein
VGSVGGVWCDLGVLGVWGVCVECVYSVCTVCGVRVIVPVVSSVRVRECGSVRGWA